MSQPQISPAVAPSPGEGPRRVHVGVIKRYQDFVALREQWEAVYDADPDAQFFLSWTFFSNWLHKAEEIEAKTGGWFVLVAKTSPEATDCLAILPLRLSAGNSEEGRPIARLVMGGRRYADYTGILCRPDAEAWAIPALAETVKRLTWDRWELEFLWCSETRLQRLLGCFPSPLFRMHKQKTSNPDEDTDKAICPYVELPGSWDEYLAPRAKLRRLLRTVEKSRDLAITDATPDTIQRDIKIILQLWKNKWQEHKGDKLQAILQVSATMLYRNFLSGSAGLLVMWHDRRPVGAQALWFDERKRAMYSALSGRDETFERPSPGRVLHALSIRRAITMGFKVYDFGRGNEPFKYELGTADRRIRSIVIKRCDRTV